MPATKSPCIFPITYETDEIVKGSWVLGPPQILTKTWLTYKKTGFTEEGAVNRNLFMCDNTVFITSD